MDPGWEKMMMVRLSQDGLTWEQSRKVIGILVEERQCSDRQGYIRGYNKGYDDGYARGRDVL